MGGYVIMKNNQLATLVKSGDIEMCWVCGGDATFHSTHILQEKKVSLILLSICGKCGNESAAELDSSSVKVNPMILNHYTKDRLMN